MRVYVKGVSELNEIHGRLAGTCPQASISWVQIHHWKIFLLIDYSCFCFGRPKVLLPSGAGNPLVKWAYSDNDFAVDAPFVYMPLGNSITNQIYIFFFSVKNFLKVHVG